MKLSSKSKRALQNISVTFDKAVSHEEAAINNIFAESDAKIEVEQVTRSINIDPPEDKTLDAFENADYGLDDDASLALWEEEARRVAQEFNPFVIRVMAAMDGIKSVEGHISKVTSSKAELLDERAVADISQMLDIKLRTIILDMLDFPDDQKVNVFLSLILKQDSKHRLMHPMEALSKYFSVSEEDDPYGVSPKSSTTSMVKPLGR